jgi:hypothetical protein
LIDNARLVRTAVIRENLEEKYSEPGMENANIPDFESYVQQFIDETSYEPKTFITYPESGSHGINILAEDVSVIKAFNGYCTENNFYSMKAELPEGTRLKVVLKEGLWYYRSLPAPENWTVSTYDEVNRMQEFTVKQSGTPNDLAIGFEAGEITVEYYENGATVPSRVKQLTAEGEIITPPDSTNLKSQSFYFP